MTSPAVDKEGVDAAEVDVEAAQRSRVALAVSLLLNIFFLVALNVITRPPGALPPARVHAGPALQVRLIEARIEPVRPVVEPPLPATARVRAPRTRPRRVVQSVSPAAPVVDSEAPQADVDAADRSAQLRLFGTDGRLLLPETKAGDVSAATAFAGPPKGDAFARRNTVPYEPTRFESVWVPRDETLGGELIRKLTLERSWLTPWGTQISCAWILIMGGCGWGPAPSLTIEELKAMHADPPLLKHPYVEPADGQ